MNKLTSPIHITQTILLSSLIASVGFLSLPSLSVAEEVYRNCAQLQKHLNENNPGLIVKGFERVKMRRQNTDQFQRSYMVFCNGGIVIDRRQGEGTMCRGHIAYYFSYIRNDEDHIASWGITDGSPNEHETDKEKYCRRIK
jgi:hypothetical protein